MFATGSYVVYGVNGVCRVAGVTAFCAPGSDEKKDYYVLEPVGRGGGTVYVPISGNKVVLRAVMTKKEAQDFIETIPSLEPLKINGDKHREEAYKKAMVACDCAEWVRIIRTLYIRRQERLKQGKQVTAMDARYWKAAERFLYSELALALSREPEEMEAYITGIIEKNGRKA